MTKQEFDAKAKALFLLCGCTSEYESTEGENDKDVIYEARQGFHAVQYRKGYLPWRFFFNGFKGRGESLLEAFEHHGALYRKWQAQSKPLIGEPNELPSDQ